MAEKFPTKRSVQTDEQVEVIDTFQKPATDFAPNLETMQEKPPEPAPTPTTYMCMVECWVSSKRQHFKPGDLTTFFPGDFIPSHFRPL